MKEKLHKLAKWAITILSERDGTGSSARVALLVIVASACFCLIFLVVAERKLPDGQTCLGLSGLITSGGAIYGANRLTKKDDAPNVDAPTS